jgi:hypothetical protein
LNTDQALAHFAWQASGDTRHLERLYEDQIAASAVREYINTEGSPWIDRVTVNDAELQRARLGGVALVRNSTYPGHVVSWSFDAPGAQEQVAILLPEASPQHVRITGYNIGSSVVTARMTAWDIEPGRWRVTEGSNVRMVDLERTGELEITFAPRVSTEIELTLVSKGVPYWSRPDLGIAARDVHVSGDTLTVIVHSLGAIDAPASRVVVRHRDGRILASATVAALKAPVDLRPKNATVRLRVPRGADLTDCSVTVESHGAIPEITLRNNQVRGLRLLGQ